MQGIFRKENTDKALKYGIYRHLPTYEKIIRNLISFYIKLAGKILLVPVWLILFVIGLAVKMTVQTYAVVRGILGFIFTLLIIATAYCYHDWVQVAFLFSLSVILYLILFAGVFVDTVLDMTRESIIDFILS